MKVKGAKQLIDQYSYLEMEYGDEAPVAMLSWCQQAERSEDERCALLARVLEKLLVNRCLNVWRAKRDGDDPQEVYEDAANEARRIIHMAGIVEENAGVVED